MVDVADHVGMVNLHHVLELMFCVALPHGADIDPLPDEMPVFMADELDSGLCVLVQDLLSSPRPEAYCLHQL